MFQSRTHTCNELRLENVGEKVKIVGWMENVREVGNNFAFVVVRDFYGTTQVVVETEEMMNIVHSVNKESTISVEGVVCERASKNPKQATAARPRISAATTATTNRSMSPPSPSPSAALTRLRARRLPKLRPPKHSRPSRICAAR